MEYTIKKLGDLASISTRALRYYDSINLLNPSYTNSSGYRIYTSKEVDKLQQILFYKELNMPLKEISSLINSSGFNAIEALNKHSVQLTNRKSKIETLLINIDLSIQSLERNIIMNDKEKFEGFKDKTIRDNTEKYGEELNELYGHDVIKEANTKYKKLSKYEIKKQELLSQEIDILLVKAVGLNDIHNSVSRELCQKHQEWIQSYWPSYSKSAHLSLVEMYLSDERFKSYYEKRVLGGAIFLRNAMKVYLDI